jgi:hypothetical protein
VEAGCQRGQGSPRAVEPGGWIIPKFSLRAAPLHRLKGEGIQFEWGEKQQASFESLKKSIV